MAKTTQAVGRHRRAGLPYIVVLTNPTFGGVLASYGGLGQVTFAIPGARVGFAGRRVMQASTGQELPVQLQTGENLTRLGLIDDVVPVDSLRERVARLLAVTVSNRAVRSPSPLPDDVMRQEDLDAWKSLRRSRKHNRPSSMDLISVCASDITLLRGSRSERGEGNGCVAALARVGEIPAVIIAHDRRKMGGGVRVSTADCRKARRAIALASELKLPVLSVLDTSGGMMDQESEESGLSLELASCLLDFISCQSPTVTVLMGEGAGGGAMALFPADRVLCAEHAWLAPIDPEAASAIVYQSTELAAELARSQKISSWDLYRRGIADLVVRRRAPPRASLHECRPRSTWF